MSKYKFKTEPYLHQLDVLRESWSKPHWALFCDMGTGKSKMVIDNVGALWEREKVGGLVVVAPKGTYMSWVKQVDLHLPDSIDRRVAYFRSGGNRKETAALEEIGKPQARTLDILLVNTEAINVKRARDMLESFLRSHEDCFFVIDESTKIKNHKAKTTERLLDLAPLAKYRRILSGQPMPNGPLDLYSQCEFLHPGILGFDSFYAFRGRYAILMMQQRGSKRFQQVLGYQNEKELSQKLRGFAHVIKKEDCLDLEPKIFETYEVELSPDQKKIYDDLKNIALHMWEDGSMTTVDSVVTQIIRLHQVVCGYTVTDEGEMVDLPNNRLKELMNLLQEVRGKVIIWAHYRYCVEMIAKEIAKEYGENSVTTYYGGTSQKQRVDAVENFQDPDSKLRFLVANEAAAYGLTLTAAQTNIYYANSYNLDVRQQSEDRTHRIGQEGSVVYVDMITRGSIDEHILAALQKKAKLADLILKEGFREYV